MKKTNPNSAMAHARHAENYPRVLELVKKGGNINSACRAIGIHSSTLYKYITEEQRIELISYKATTAVYGGAPSCGCGSAERDRDFIELENDDDENY